MFEMFASWAQSAAAGAPPFFLILSALVACAAVIGFARCLFALAEPEVLELTAEMAIREEGAREHARPAGVRSAIEPWRRRASARASAATPAPGFSKAA